MSRNYDLIIFDWDGTLVDSIDWIVQCIQNAAKECQCEVPEGDDIRDIIGLSIENAARQLFPGISAEKQQQLISCYSHYFLSKQSSPDDLFYGVKDMLHKFKASGYKLAVATGKKNAGLMKAMAGTGTHEFFSATRSADQTASKPDPLMINQIVQEMNVSKPRTLMVGDSAHDMLMAKNAGVAAVAVECGAHRNHILTQYNPIFCLAHTRALLNVI